MYQTIPTVPTVSTVPTVPTKPTKDQLKIVDNINILYQPFQNDW